jgi:hypothetical protein
VGSDGRPVAVEWPATISRFFRRLFRQKSSAHGYVMLLTKLSPPQPARLKCLNQLLRFCTAPPLLLNSPIASFSLIPQLQHNSCLENRCVPLTHTLDFRARDFGVARIACHPWSELEHGIWRRFGPQFRGARLGHVFEGSGCPVPDAPYFRHTQSGSNRQQK